jgi:cell wall-associated NlpC family hydrolase
MRYTATDPVAAAVLQQETLGAQAVSIALRFIGVPYVWGGATPSGFDCSGLTMYVYGLLGVQLSHWTGNQWNEGTSVPWEQMQPGDLIFFDLGNGVPQHEGMYVGRGLMVQAPQRGDIVRVVSLSANRYAERFVRAVRPY